MKFLGNMQSVCSLSRPRIEKQQKLCNNTKWQLLIDANLYFSIIVLWRRKLQVDMNKIFRKDADMQQDLKIGGPTLIL